VNGGGGPIVVKLGDSQAFSQQLTERADALALATGRAVVAGRVLSVPAPWIGRDAPHAFYLGAELMKAEIGWRLGKRYAQDEPLDWGYAVDRAPEDRTRRRVGHTLRSLAAG
jgi:hypothetical protein